MRVRDVLLPAVATLAPAALLAVETPPRPSPATVRPIAVPTPTIEGIVRGPGGKPIERARVVAQSMNAEPGEQARSTRTDAQGRFQLVAPGRGKHRVRAEAPGLAGRMLGDVVPGTPLTIDLARGGTVEGVVRDGDDANLERLSVGRTLKPGVLRGVKSRGGEELDLVAVRVRRVDLNRLSVAKQQTVRARIFGHAGSESLRWTSLSGAAWTSRPL